MNAKVPLILLTGFVVAGIAKAAPYWVAYEGNDFPENVGWTRWYGDENGSGHGGAARSIVDGVLTLDSMRNHLIYDYYQVNRSLSPDPGEVFVADWRLKIDAAVGPVRDVGVTIARDGMGTLALRFGIDNIWSEREGWTVPFDPLQFHAFHLESPDMLTYSLAMDGAPIAGGTWDLDSFNESYLAFGDGGSGGGVLSYSEWDYVRFGVVPEPASLVCAGVALWILVVVRGSR